MNESIRRVQMATALVVVSLISAGCMAPPGRATSKQNRERPPVVATSERVAPPPSFFADRRGRDVGDMLTVLITEFSTVEATARTTTGKSESASASLSHSENHLDVAAANLDNNFSGGGQIERTGKLVGKLAVTVSGVDASGNLLVHGEQDILINNERQRIRLDGTVRPEDIGPDNTIPSWRVSGAHIEFTGKGFLAHKQSPGLLTRILSWFWE
jgi:flagellar L-ring protein precursor FlgH